MRVVILVCGLALVAIHEIPARGTGARLDAGVDALFSQAQATDRYQRLVEAAWLERPQIVKALLAEIDAQRSVELQAAVTAGDLKKVIALVVAGASGLDTALMSAAERGDRKMVKFLLAAGGATDLNDLLRKSISSYKHEATSFLTTFEEVDLDLALRVAAKRDNYQDAMLLMELGADDFAGALLAMAKSNPTDSMLSEVLIERVTDIDALNAALLAALGSAAEIEAMGFLGGAGAFVHMLIRAGANDLEGGLRALAKLSALTHENYADDLREIFAVIGRQPQPSRRDGLDKFDF